jgi:glutamine amidotransferase
VQLSNPEDEKWRIRLSTAISTLMCELLGICSDQPMALDFEWDEFARHGSPGGGNPDGWGAGYYRGLDVATFREPRAAVDSDCAKFLGQCAPPSSLVISHVRRAVRGASVLANCQPFARPMASRMHLFAHNGYVANPMAPPGPPSWLAPIGDTDSELLFSLLLARLEPVWSQADPPSVKARLDVVRDFAALMREQGAVNFIYSDGELLFAHGHRRTLPGDAVSTDPGLYLLERGGGCPEPFDTPVVGLRTSGTCQSQALVATVPLNTQKWTPLGSGELICLREGTRVA